MDIIEKATQVAVNAHAGQVRKSDGTPYIAHPLTVARMLDKAGFDEVTVAAAILHDVLEDTSLSREELQNVMGDEILHIVEKLSEDTSLKWEERKQRYIDTVKHAEESVKAVSVGDKIHNLRSLIDAYKTQGPSIWKKFNRGKDTKLWFEMSLLEALRETWDHPLLDTYESLIHEVEAFDAD